MSGDQIKIFCESYYMMPGSGPGSPLTMTLTDLLSSFVNSNVIISSKGTLSTTDVGNVGTNATNLNNFISNNNNSGAGAYLNWILFDEQLNYISAGVNPVNSGSNNTPIYTNHDYFINNPVHITKNGFLYIFVSNESNFPSLF